jgi:hypothetical protein
MGTVQAAPPRDDFHFFTPVNFFEKAGAEEGFRRRIGGLVTTQGKDQENETVLQRGLDFSPFINKGFYNDNHSKKQTGVLGFPDHVQFYKKGVQLPDGDVAPNDGHWAEGFLLEGWEPSDKIWQLGQALKKTRGARRLGFSIEGTIQRRIGPDRKTIAKALVKNVAITHCPVNVDTGLAILAKSLERAEQESPDELERALTAGAGSTIAPTGPKTGEGAGAVLMPESLESKMRNLTKSEAVAWFLTRHPNQSVATAGRFVDATLGMVQRGLI